MDWTKAKTIVIIALLITNLFLIITYGISRGEPQRDEKERQAETIALLEKRNIFIETEIPEGRGRMPVLTVEYDHLDQTLLLQEIQKQETLPGAQRSEKGIQEKVQEFLADCGVWSEHVTLDRIEQEENRMILFYKNVVGETLLEDSYMVCTVEGGRVTALSRYWLKPLEFGKAKQDTISPSVALLHFMSENKEEDVIYVDKMEMVYWLDPASIDTESPVLDTAWPAWKITYNNGKVVHIDAYEK